MLPVPIALPPSIAAFLRETPLALWAAIVVPALALEALVAAEAQPARGKVLNLLNGAVVCAAVFLVAPLASLWTYSVEHRLGLGWIELPSSSGHALMSAIGGGIWLMFVGDLLFYAWHRAEHGVPALWSIHAVHHSDEALNVTTYLRQHWLDSPLQRLLLTTLLALLFRFTPAQAFVMTAGNALFDFFTHMNVRLRFGRWSWLVTGPQLHRLHHSRLRQHWDTNFAQVFPMIDRFFGTYVAPDWDEFPPTGLPGRERIESMSALLLWPFAQWLRRSPKTTLQ